MLNGNQVTVKEKSFSTLHIIQCKAAKDKLLVQTSQKETSHFLTVIQQYNSKSPLNNFYSLKVFLILAIKGQIASLIQVCVCTDNSSSSRLRVFPFMAI